MRCYQATFRVGHTLALAVCGAPIHVVATYVVANCVVHAFTFATVLIVIFVNGAWALL